MDLTDAVRINVGGTLFMTSKKTLTTFPNTKLSRLAPGIREYDQKADTYFFDRNPILFGFILDCYRNGRFHFPNYLCGTSVMEELEYWGLDEKVIANCCLKSFDDYDERRKTLEKIYKTANCDMKEKAQQEVMTSTGVKKFRYQLWLFLEYPNSSKSAKIWSIINLIFVLISILSFCLQSCPEFRRDDPLVDDVTRAHAMNETNQKRRRFALTRPDIGTIFFDVIINSLFTIDILYRLLFSPDFKKFMKCFNTWVELLCVVTFWVYQGLTFYKRSYGIQALGADGDRAIYVFVVLQPLRILRFLKLSHVFVDYRAILLSVRNSVTEFVVLILFIVTAMMFFSVLIFIAELDTVNVFDTIPESFWWAIVTMTTVGYGDVVPKSAVGYVVGSVCAVCGIVITGMAISVLSMKLGLYQEYARLERNAWLHRENMHSEGKDERNRPTVKT